MQHRSRLRSDWPSFQGSGFTRCTVVYALRRCDPRAIERRALRAASRGGGIWWLPWRRHPPQLLPENFERVIDGLCAQRDRLVRPLGWLSVAVLAMFPTAHPMKPAKHDLKNTSHACLTRVCYSKAALIQHTGRDLVHVEVLVVGEAPHKNHVRLPGCELPEALVPLLVPRGRHGIERLAYRARVLAEADLRARGGPPA